MPPRLPVSVTKAGSSLIRPAAKIENKAVCFFCSLTSTSRPVPTRRSRRKASNQRRLQSTSTTITPPPSELDARKELEDVLLQLQKHAANFVNLSRLQLAINGLRQPPGSESIRVAILGLTNGRVSSDTAKQVLKMLLADPLKDKEQWEQEVDKHDLAQPMIIRVGQVEQQQSGPISPTRGNLLHEVHVSSPTLNGHSIELLLTETNPYVSSAEDGVEGLEDAILVPTVDIPTSSTGRYTPVTTPVHKALLITDGIMGAATLASMPLAESADVIAAAVNIPGYKETDIEPLPFTPVDVETAATGLRLIRKSLSEAMEYEHMWFQSNIPKLIDWVKADVISTIDGTTKPPVRRLIASLLQSATNSIHLEETRMLSDPLESATARTSSHLGPSLAAWAESAHTELQDQLDLAFSSSRWRKLGWWKLFWRVDDVHMLTSDILAQRFLPASEKSAIYLAGRIQEAAAPNNTPVIYSAPSPSENSDVVMKPGLWPTNIPAARAYLQNETIPALQALAQKLVFQALSTSGLTTSLGALAYFGTLTTGIYEAGTVAALGIVWSLRNMQKRWETARSFWEEEVREEGRKAVRGVEVSVEKVLKQSDIITSNTVVESEELTKARQLVEKATDALNRLK